MYRAILLGSSIWNILIYPPHALKPHPNSLTFNDKLSSLATLRVLVEYKYFWGVRNVLTQTYSDIASAFPSFIALFPTKLINLMIPSSSIVNILYTYFLFSWFLAFSSTTSCCVNKFPSSIYIYSHGTWKICYG